MKKIVTLFVLIVMVVGLMSVNVSAFTSKYFTDMDRKSYAYSQAEELCEAGIVSGYSDGTFKTEKKVTRAEMATFICRALGEEETAKQYMGTTTALTKDVGANHWASGYVYHAVSKNIINGYGNGEFRPENNVTYKEAVKMIVCAMGLEDKVKKDSSDWAKGYLDVADQYGITEYVWAYQNDYVNRGDVVIMLHNAIKDKLHYLSFGYSPLEYEIDNFEELKGLRLEGTVIPLKVTPEYGYEFVKWEIEGDGYIKDINSSQTEFVMGNEDAVVSAVCEKTESEEPEEEYIKYDENGNLLQYKIEVRMLGCGGIRRNPGQYTAGSNVALYILEGTEKGFIKWTTTAGKIFNPKDPTTVITMPNEDIVVYAWFTPDGSEPKGTEYYVDNGDGTFTYFPE